MDARAELDIRVLLADDHPVVRSGLASLLQSLPGITVVGEAGDGRAAVREALLLSPDVVIMDLRMPVLDGVAATAEILRIRPATAVLVLTMFDEDELILAAVDAGARGYLLKGAEQEQIVRAVQAVAAGESIFGGSVARKVLHRAALQPARPALPALTPRERQVTHLMATGAANAAIAVELCLSPKTLGNHISAIFAKLGVASRAEAIVLARDAGLGRGTGLNAEPGTRP